VEGSSSLRPLLGVEPSPYLARWRSPSPPSSRRRRGTVRAHPGGQGDGADGRVGTRRPRRRPR
jgi:hypothetical protein